MALSIKTEEADRLARTLAALTGETMTEAVTRALRERLKRVRDSAPEGEENLVAELKEFSDSIRPYYDARPVRKVEWDEACGDTPEDLGLRK